MSFTVGMKVLARFAEEAEHYAGTIVKVHQDREADHSPVRYSVAYDDGDYEEYVDPAMIIQAQAQESVAEPSEAESDEEEAFDLDLDIRDPVIIEESLKDGVILEESLEEGPVDEHVPAPEEELTVDHVVSGFARAWQNPQQQVSCCSNDV